MQTSRAEGVTLDPGGPDTVNPQTRQYLLRDYETMATARAFEDHLHASADRGEIPGAVHLAAGQEAVAVGVCSVLEPQDYLSSTHRGHAHALAKGCDPAAMLLEIYGKDDGVCRGRGGSMHIADFDHGMLGANGVAAGGVPIACGAALAAKHLGLGRVAVAFLGDGAVNQGVFSESLTLAAVWQLPVVFVVEDNGYAQCTGTHFHLQGIPVAERARAHGVPAVTVDGSDYFAVRTAAGEAVARARETGLPGLVEAHVARFYGHMEGFDHQGYRAQGEVERERHNRDPLLRFERTVTARGWLGAEALAEARERAGRRVRDAARQVEDRPYPDPARVADFVLSSTPSGGDDR